MKENKKRILIIVLAFFLLLVLFIQYLQATYFRAISNTRMDNTDQKVYLDTTNWLVQSRYQDFYRLERNRMPFFILILSSVYNPNVDVFFNQGKTLNIWISVSLLALLFLIFSKYLPLLWTLNLTLITAFSVFIFKASYVQSEVTYYFLFFLTFLLVINLLKKPTIKIATIAGFTAGITHLTKASLPPLLLLFVVIFV